MAFTKAPLGYIQSPGDVLKLTYGVSYLSALAPPISVIKNMVELTGKYSWISGSYDPNGDLILFVKVLSQPQITQAGINPVMITVALAGLFALVFIKDFEISTPLLGVKSKTSVMGSATMLAMLAVGGLFIYSKAKL